MKIYLAGPDVFLSHATDIFEEKKEICRVAGFEAFSPFDNELGVSPDLGGPELGLAIAKANFKLMDLCDGTIANLSPFRGPSADVGTVGEVFYMSGTGKKVWAYSNEADHYKDRISNRIAVNNILFDSKGMKIEDFSLWDNLMIPEAITRSGGFFRQSEYVQPIDYIGIFKALVEEIVQTGLSK